MPGCYLATRAILTHATRDLGLKRSQLIFDNALQFDPQRLFGVWFSPCKLWNWGHLINSCVPEEPRAAIYLNSIGLFRCLEEFDVSIIGEHLDRTNRDQIILPLTKFSSDFDAEKVTNVIYERLDELKLITSNIKSTIIETFGELTNNATQHANSSIASYQDDSFRQLHNRAEHSFAL